MQDISYRITYSGVRLIGGTSFRQGNGDIEIATVRARSINTGFAKALKRAQEPLGSGERREIVRIEFWEVH